VAVGDAACFPFWRAGVAWACRGRGGAPAPPPAASGQGQRPPPELAPPEHARQPAPRPSPPRAPRRLACGAPARSVPAALRASRRPGDPRSTALCSRPPIWPAAGEPRLSRHRGRVPHVVDERDDLGAVERLVLQVDEHLGHLGLPEEEIASGTPRRRVRGGHLGLLALRSRQPLVLGRVVELGPVRRVRLVAPAAVLALGTAGRARVHEELDAKTRGGRVLFANLHISGR